MQPISVTSIFGHFEVMPVYLKIKLWSTYFWDVSLYLNQGQNANRPVANSSETTKCIQADIKIKTFNKKVQVYPRYLHDARREEQREPMINVGTQYQLLTSTGLRYSQGFHTYRISRVVTRFQALHGGIQEVLISFYSQLFPT